MDLATKLNQYLTKIAQLQDTTSLIRGIVDAMSALKASVKPGIVSQNCDYFIQAYSDPSIAKQPERLQKLNNTAIMQFMSGPKGKGPTKEFPTYNYLAVKENNGDIESPAGRAVAALNNAMLALRAHLQTNPATQDLANRITDMYVDQVGRNYPGSSPSKIDPQYDRIVNQQIASAQKVVKQYDAGQESQTLIDMAETLRTSLPKANDYLRKNNPNDPRVKTIDDLLNDLLRVEVSFKYLGRTKSAPLPNA